MRKTRRAHASVWALVTLALGVAACGSSGGSTPSGSQTANSSAAKSAATASSVDVAGAKAEVNKYLGAPTFDPMAPPFDASKAKGKLVFDIPISSALPFISSIDGGEAQAAKAAGVKLQIFPNQGTIPEWVKAFNQAIAEKANLIILDAAPAPSQLQPQLKQAAAAHIPVIATHMPQVSEFPPGTLPADNVANTTAVVPGPFPLTSRLQADYAIANTPGGKAHALIVTSNEVAASRGIVEMTQQEFQKRCGTACKTTVVNVPLVDWATKLQGAVQSALVADPSINWVIPIYDSMAQFAVPGIAAAHRTGSARIATFNGTPFVLKDISNGTAAMDSGENENWLGWAFMDQALRILSGNKPVNYPTAPTPVRVWDKSNVAEAGTPPGDSTGYGDAYKAGYLKLWGLS